MPRRADEILVEARRRLAAAPFEAPPREARLLLARVLGVSEAALLAHPETRVAAGPEARFAELLERRLRGEPVAYLFAEKEFFGRTFHVDHRVLVPRPETEHLVEKALEIAGAGGRILDVGTGSGCIAITLALELPDAEVTATDVSLGALRVAAHNRRLHRAPIRLAAARGLDALAAERFDLVVANLPYLDPADPALAPEVLRWEPAQALFAGPAGLEGFRELFAGADRLASGAACVLEIGADQAEAVAALGRQYHLRLLATVRDYADRDRVLVMARS